MFLHTDDFALWMTAWVWAYVGGLVESLSLQQCHHRMILQAYRSNVTTTMILQAYRSNVTTTMILQAYRSNVTTE